MRMPPTGRGLPPEIDGNTLHLWTLDEGSATTAIDLVGAENLATSGTAPTAITTNAIGPAGRTFNGGLLIGSSTGTDASSVTGNMTVIAVVRLPSSWSTQGVVVSYAGPLGDGGQVNNNLFSLSVNANRTISIDWEDAAQANKTVTSTYVIPTGRWVPICVRRTVSGGVATHTLALYGETVETLAGDTDPAVEVGVGDQQKWRIGSLGGTTDFPFVGDIDLVAIYDEDKSDTWVENQFRRMRRIGYPDVFHSRVKVVDGNGDLQDLTDLGGVDWVESITMQDGVDQQTATASVRLLRESYSQSLAKYHDNRLNRLPLDAIGPDASTYDDGAELLDVNRRIVIETARMPRGLTPASRDWQSLFDGEIDAVDWSGNESVITLECRDLGCKLQNAGIEDETAYSNDSSGTAVETVMQDIIDDTLGGGVVTLYTPTSPGWMIKQFTQRREDVHTAISTLAGQIGWSIKTTYDEGTSSHRVTFYQPDRTYAVTKAMAVLDADDYLEITQLKIDRANIRNVVRVSYDSKESPAPSSWTYAGGGGGLGTDGKPTRAWVEVTSADLSGDSITRFGRRFMEVAEEATKGIDTKDEAEDMAVAMCRDLMDPVADKSVTMWLLPEVAIGTCLKFRADDVHYTADQRMAVVGFQHSITKEATTTEVILRGKPTAGVSRHLATEGRAGLNPPPIINGAEVLTAMSTRGRLAAVQQSIVSSPQRAGRAVGPFNHDFGQHLVSRQQPPDGWTQTGGTYGTDATVNDTASNVLTGSQSLQLRTSSAVLKSSLMPVHDAASGGVTKTFKLAVPMKASANTTGTVQVDWLDIDQAAISTSSVISATVGTSWVTYRGVVDAPTNARFARVVLGRGTGSTEVYVDRVMMAPARPSFRAYVTADATITQKDDDVVVEFNNDSAGRPTGWDDGGNFDASTDFYFVAPEDGPYFFETQVAIEANTSTGDCRGYVRLIKNGGGADPNNPSLTAGTMVARSPQVDNFSGADRVYLRATARVWLSKDDTMEVRVYADDNSGAASPKVIGGAYETWFTGEMLADE